jgi:endonuclease/exonuclease/phosphatase family metal-dependent hydrolase
MKQKFQVYLIFALAISSVFGLCQPPTNKDNNNTTKQSENPNTPSKTPNNGQSSTPNNEQGNAQNPRTPRAKNDELLVLSWNLYNFGKSKTIEQIQFIANTLRHYDVVAIQEVSTSASGAQMVALLADELDRKGADWDYVVSDPTTGEGAERYAYLWKTSRVSLKNRPFLSKPLEATINREPFMARFEAKNGKTIMVANFHAVPTAKKPENEISQLDQLHTSYRDDNLMVMGDFNYAADKPGFSNLIQKGYAAGLKPIATSLKQKLDAKGNYLSEAYDNIFYETSSIEVLEAESIDFVPNFKTLTEARALSDHLPVWVKIKVK